MGIHRTVFQDNRAVRQAFEVEKILTAGPHEGHRANFTYEWDAENQRMLVWDTSRGVGKKSSETINSEDAWESFRKAYNDALTTFDFQKGILIGWVDPDTIEPIDDDEEAVEEDDEAEMDLEKYLKDAGFDSEEEFRKLVAAVDLSTIANIAEFKEWQANDGSKEGLLKLQKAK